MRLCYTLLIFSILIVSSNSLLSQEGELIFDYLKAQVKTVYLSKTERFDYEYSKGLIIERQELSSEGLIERHYYYLGKLDSIVYLEIYPDTTYRTMDIYNYQDGLLLAIQYGVNSEEGIVKIDSFNYDSDNSILSVDNYANKVEEIFGTKKIASAKWQFTKKFHYDSGQLTRISRGNGPLSTSVEYEYDEEGRVIKEIQNLGQKRDGCIVEGEELSCEVYYHYNEYGLRTKRIHRYSIISPNGSKRRKGRIRYNWKYEYY